MILVITNTQDITTDLVIDKLQRLKAPYYRFNTDQFGPLCRINLDYEQEKEFIYDSFIHRQINISEIRSVYYRRPVLPDITYPDLTHGERGFLNREITYLFDGLFGLLENRFWISPVWAIRRAEVKLNQLKVAKQVGFEIPASIISNSPEHVRIFVERNARDCIIKPIKTGLIDDNERAGLIYTTTFRPQRDIDIERTLNFPTYFQKRINKYVDVRVTVVGKTIFAASIHSQDYAETEIDWRKASNITLKHERLALPQHISDKCVRLVEIFGLKFAAIDLVLDKMGKYIFLEINPNGQWAWIEKRLDYDISGTIASMLYNGG